ncbi:SDR family NAD(P)-dependent oxidoreductase [Mycobacterium sp. TY814]|uniref:SDR family NAD(P)-dependent oxidoreductase n=1 Tax=unclassified Mycobacterium TaxID=2642494 RepID=UPI002740E776|nr:SDR family NAD(P)-dependent oxidoreductase [Mycobacterium sp. TY814]MDP7721571.1 SDR family NAD(P)-dependent oxidoreductase [Mycobacterium sp. TY814]
MLGTRRQRLALDARVALITSAGQGIGLALARHLYARGANVALLDVDGAAARQAASELGSRACGLAADVRDRGAMAEVVGAVVRHFGALDIVVANAGVTPAPATLRTMNPDDAVAAEQADHR